MKKLLSIFSAFLVSILGAFGGLSEFDKNYRRVGIPLVFLLFSYLEFRSWYCLYALIGTVVNLGYGMPSTTGGSDIAKFWYKITKENWNLTNILTRGTVGLVNSLLLIYIPIAKENWLIYILGTLIYTLVQAFVAWRDLGQTKIIKWNANNSDLIVYLTLGLFFFSIIY